MARTVRPSLPDLISAVVLTVFVTGSTFGVAHFHDHVHHVPGVAALWIVAGGVPLLWRSRAPLSSYVVSAALVLGYYASPYPAGPSLVLPTLALMTLAFVRGPLVAAIAAGASVVVAIAAVQLAGDPAGAFDPRQLAIVLWGTLAVTIGTVGQLRRAARREVAERAAEADRRRAEEQRLGIAREVHDVVAHSLAMINVQAGVAAHVADRRPDEAKAALLAIKEASRSALSDLRATLGVLRAGDDRAPTPGLGRLPDLISTAAAAGLTVRADGDAGSLPAPVDVAAYRILQESLTNVVRHGTGADLVVITLARTPRELRITVSDNGRATPKPGTNAGNGLRGMAERATALGGGATAGPRLDGGFEVFATLPVTAGEPDDD
jgi:signal transduction histidine kinase